MSAGHGSGNVVCMKYLAAQSRIHQYIDIMADIAQSEIAAQVRAYQESTRRSFGQIIRHQVAKRLRVRAGK